MSHVYTFRVRGRIVAAAATRKELLNTYYVIESKPTREELKPRSKSKPQSVWISWCKGPVIRYDFPDLAQLNAFLKGIEESASRTHLDIEWEQFDV